jgi:leucyl-tRNA synthetase
MSGYKAQETEKKWQEIWAEQKAYETDLNLDSKPKYYNLVMFPYPSGDKLHIGHWYNYAPLDSYGRFMKMCGFNVFQPMGFDSFGLPAENYAIKTGVPPQKSITQNTGYMKKQLSEMGAMWDFSKSVVTSTPEYYKWTQWVFLKLFEKGLAYKHKAAVNWCGDCQTVLANEQVHDGVCERCKNEVTKRDLAQWFFKIKNYAEQLLDFSQLDWPEKTTTMQKNWIGKSMGANIVFDLPEFGEQMEVFTTRPDTLFGCTYVVLAPEHPLIEKITSPQMSEEVSAYIEKTRKESDIERQAEDREKTGVFTGAFALNPINGEQVPVWVADYVLMNYGSGCVMAVPAHDQRDFEFAKRFDLPIRQVVKPIDEEIDLEKSAFTGSGILIDSAEFGGVLNTVGGKSIVNKLKSLAKGSEAVNYRLKDWLISRQRYWGAPIPIVYDPQGKAHPIGEEHLPWLLPEDVEFKPTGESPLVNSKEFRERTEKIFGKGWTPEFDTMDTFMCSSWYFFRYLSSQDSTQAFDKNLAKKWLPVDMYVGGPEHACMHLLYARFLTMALFDMGISPMKEPFKRLVHQGMVTKDGAKMSKSKGNVVSPDSFIEEYGADVFRMYLMFMGPFTQGGDWNDQGIMGVKRFVDRFHKMIVENSDVQTDSKHISKLHETLKKVRSNIEKMHFNVAIAALMEFVNFVGKHGIDSEIKKEIVKAIAPLAPHLSEELWEKIGDGKSVFAQNYPQFDEQKILREEIEIVVQVNGKVRGKIMGSPEISEEEVLQKALEIENVQRFIEGKDLKKKIYVRGKLVSFVV